MNGEQAGRMEEAPEGSIALAEMLAADLRARLGHAAPIVVYAWTRRVERAGRPRTSVLAKLFRRHRSHIIEGVGIDATQAYRRLVDRAVEWTRDQDPA